MAAAVIYSIKAGVEACTD
ncbi:hypothetical protein VCHE16_0134, partial [Vibrio paracholerae HE-16]